MTVYAHLFIATLLLSCAPLYLAWSHVRLQFFRQRLFEIRDELWDAARVLECFTDPAYVEARNGLNAVISIGHLITLPFLVNAIDTFREAGPKNELGTSANAEMQDAIDKAIKSASLAIETYCWRWQLTGWICRMMSFSRNVPLHFGTALARSREVLQLKQDYDSAAPHATAL